MQWLLASLLKAQTGASLHGLEPCLHYLPACDLCTNLSTSLSLHVPKYKIGFILIYLAGLLPRVREMICVKLLSAWHIVIQANKMIIHLMELETEAQEGTDPRPHIKLIVDPERGRDVRLGSTLEVGNKQRIHSLLPHSVPEHRQVPSLALGTEDAGLWAPRFYLV